MLTVLCLVAVILLVAAIGVLWMELRVDLERVRVAQEARLAEWQLRQLTRQALQRMLDEARQGHGRDG
jgi:type II secretory pathway component PulK